CDSEPECKGIDDGNTYYWYDDQCHAKAACSADDLSSCDSEPKCKDSGFIWYAGKCLVASPCSPQNVAGCTEEKTCEANGGEWHSDYHTSSGVKCIPKTSSAVPPPPQDYMARFLQMMKQDDDPVVTCGPDHLDACDQAACAELGAAYWWYADSCRPAQQEETYSKISEAPVRLGNDADDGVISAGEGLSIIVAFSEQGRHYALLVLPNNDYFFIVDNDEYVSKQLTTVADNVSFVVWDDICAVLGQYPDFIGEWEIATLTVPLSVEKFQDDNDIVDYLSKGGIYHFGYYSVMVDCSQPKSLSASAGGSGANTYYDEDAGVWRLK
ncbi:MAG: hypothetical protein J7M30_13220, partial [Deltaproteobacteria bacterium]|nr:hypothetical protein [Deltaproteobacteria bacterium]